MLNKRRQVAWWAISLSIAMLAGICADAGAQAARKTPEQMLQELNEQLDKEERERRAGRGPKAANLPSKDPCSVISEAELKRLLPSAQRGQRDTLNEPQGIARCVWKNAGGLVQLKLEVVAASGDDTRTAKMPPGGAMRQPAIGDGAVVYYFPRDLKTGLRHEIAGGQARRGGLIVRMLSDELAIQGPEPALRTLEALLQAAVARL